MEIELSRFQSTFINAIGEEVFQYHLLYMIELLIHLILGENFQTKQDWQENECARTQSSYWISCPLQSWLKLAEDSWIDFHLVHIRLESIKAQQTALHSKMQHDVGQHTKALRGRLLWSQHMINCDTASRQLVITQLLDQLAKTVRSHSYGFLYESMQVFRQLTTRES